MPIEVGSEAPDFVLKDQNNQEVRLSSFRGQRNVLLVFYPLAFTGTCQGELCSVRDNLNDFVNDNVQVLTLSVDGILVAFRRVAHRVNQRTGLRLLLRRQDLWLRRRTMIVIALRECARCWTAH